MLRTRMIHLGMMGATLTPREGDWLWACANGCSVRLRRHVGGGAVSWTPKAVPGLGTLGGQVGAGGLCRAAAGASLAGFVGLGSWVQGHVVGLDSWVQGHVGPRL